MTLHVVSLSGGLSSAVAADRVVSRFGSSDVRLWTADTLWEDDDLWRFHGELLARWNVAATTFAEGRRPLEVASDEHIIPNQKIAPCSRRLKIEPFTRWLEQQPKPITVYIGMDWWEGDRKNAPRRAYEAIAGVTVDFPLDWKPLELRPYEDVVKSWASNHRVCTRQDSRTTTAAVGASVKALPNGDGSGERFRNATPRSRDGKSSSAPRVNPGIATPSRSASGRAPMGPGTRSRSPCDNSAKSGSRHRRSSPTCSGPRMTASSATARRPTTSRRHQNHQGGG